MFSGTGFGLLGTGQGVVEVPKRFGGSFTLGEFSIA